jgi:hypothetical protein
MLVGIGVVMFQLQTNHNRLELIFIGFTKFALSNNPHLALTFQKPKKEMDGYEGTPSMNHLKFMEIDD